MRYTAFGETRYTAGTTPTSFRYTGQRQAEAGLYFYVARMYDPTLGRFLSADTYIPGAGNPQAYDRYAYSNNNPVIFIDPSGHKACELECDGDTIDPVEALYGAAWYGKWDVQEQKNNQQKVDTYLLGGFEAVLYTVAPPVGLLFASVRPGREVNGFDIAFALLPAGGKLVAETSVIKFGGKVIDDATIAGKDFNSFKQLRNFLGDAGDGNNWHHIVEQSQIKKSGFSAQQIHNIENVIAVDETIHRQISGFYNSYVRGTNIRVRNWLAGQSYEDQFNFGLQVLRNFGVIP